MSPEDTYLVFVGTIFGLVAAFVFILAKRLGRQKKKMETALADVDGLLDSRLELLPRLESAVGKHLSEEAEVFSASRELRSHAVGMQSVDERVRFEKALGGVVNRFLTTSESHPELKADKEFARLMEEVRALEEKTETACLAYNTLVKRNHKLHASFLAGLVGEILFYPKGEFFPVTGEE